MDNPALENIFKSISVFCTKWSGKAHARI